MFCLTPKTSNPINLGLDSSSRNEGCGVIVRMMVFLLFLEGILVKGIRVRARAYPGFGLALSTQFFGAARLTHVGTDPVFPLEYSLHEAVFCHCLWVVVSPNRGLKLLDFSFTNVSLLPLGQMGQHFIQPFVASSCHVVVGSQVLSQATCRVQFRKSWRIPISLSRRLSLMLFPQSRQLAEPRRLGRTLKSPQNISWPH